MKSIMTLIAGSLAAYLTFGTICATSLSIQNPHHIDDVTNEIMTSKDIFNFKATPLQEGKCFCVDQERDIRVDFIERTRDPKDVILFYPFDLAARKPWIETHHLGHISLIQKCDIAETDEKNQLSLDEAKTWVALEFYAVSHGEKAQELREKNNKGHIVILRNDFF